MPQLNYYQERTALGNAPAKLLSGADSVGQLKRQLGYRFSKLSVF
jgi:hypothetical protein